jgi:hypothetical protein
MSRKVTFADFLERVKEKHGEQYQYDESSFTNMKSKVRLVCPDHGPIWVLPQNHVRGHKPQCCGANYPVTLSVFLERAAKAHGDRYSYSLVEDFQGVDFKVPIVCSEHGVFWQTPYQHTSKGCGCPKCGLLISRPRLSQEEFIRRCEEIHGDKYDYSETVYINSHTPVAIHCPVHGPFKKSPTNHLAREVPQGCPDCVGNFRASTSLFVEMAQALHGSRYDYSEVQYTKAHDTVRIICPDHGPFHQAPTNHLTGSGCRDCGLAKGGAKRSIKRGDFLRNARLVYGDRFDYSKVEYVDYETPVSIICPSHGEQIIKPKRHFILKEGCAACGENSKARKLRMTTADFVSKALRVHQGIYSYENTVYATTHEKLTITCSVHGDFEQTASDHLSGKGCRFCWESHGARMVEKALKASGGRFVREFSPKDLINPSTGSRLYFDFYLYDPNAVIEYDGEHHFGPVNWYGGVGKADALKAFEGVRLRDQLKEEYCEDKNLPLLRIPYTEKDRIGLLVTSFLESLE